MKESLFSDCPDEQSREQRKKELKSYRTAFDFLEGQLQKKFKKPCRDYGVDWTAKQIAVNEYNQALQDVIDLIKDR